MNRAVEHVPVRVPGEDDFPDNDDYLADPLLDALLTDVLGAYDALEHIEQNGIGVAIRWKKKGGKRKGRLVYAKCEQPTGLFAHFAKGVDFVIWVAADNVKIDDWSTVQIGKQIYSACRYIGWDPGDDDHDPGPILLSHDLELFHGELADTGAWEGNRERLASEVLHPGFIDRSRER